MDKQNIETLYPLAPLQQAFLWHSLQSSLQASSPAGLLHIRCTLHGELDSALLQKAWAFVIKRHPALRSSVHWQSVKQPLQVVARQVPLPWVELDWRALEDPQSVLAAFLSEDCDRGFDLTQAPIMRLALIRLGETHYELVWSCHHLMLDGWSGALVLNQVASCYEVLRQGQPLEMVPAPSFQTYIRWLKQQDEAAAAAFWQETLKGFTTPTPLPASPPPHIGRRVACSASTYVSEKTFALQDCLRSHRLTLSTLMQGIWPLLLYCCSGESDILFGTTVSGRQADLAGVESIVGLLINVLPVRAQISPKETVIEWLQALQTKQATASRYAYASPDQIQAWSEVSGRLFDSLLVIENYPIQTAPIQTVPIQTAPIRTVQADQSLQMDNIQSGIVSTYGLTAVVKPGEVLTLTLHAAPQRFDDDILRTLLSDFQWILREIIENPARPVGDVLPRREFSAGDAPRLVPTPPSASENLSRETLERGFATPRNPLELKLAQIWESVLGVRPFSVEASFFDLGGDSLLAVQLFNQMQQQLNCTLPLATLFQAPNVRQFAALLSQEQPVSQWSSLVPIQSSGSRLPFFFHGGSADALTWARFSHLLGPEQSFYALQRPDLDGSEITHATVEALAAECVKEIRMVQPQGPYLVGGHCFGGAVAFEIAQQLQAEGEEIASVILIDAYRPETLPNTPFARLQTQTQLGLFWLRKNYYYHGGWEKLTQLPAKIWQRLKPSRTAHPLSTTPSPPLFEKGKALHPLTPPLREGQSPTPPHPPTPLPYEYRYARAQEANELAADQYFAQPYSGPIKLFRANIQTLAWYFGPTLGWQSVAKNKIETAIIPGFFGNLFNHQSGPLLAKYVKTYLSTLQNQKP